MYFVLFAALLLILWECYRNQDGYLEVLWWVEYSTDSCQCNNTHSFTN